MSSTMKRVLQIAGLLALTIAVPLFLFSTISRADGDVSLYGGHKVLGSAAAGVSAPN